MLKNTLKLVHKYTETYYRFVFLAHLACSEAYNTVYTSVASPFPTYATWAACLQTRKEIAVFTISWHILYINYTVYCTIYTCTISLVSKNDACTCF